jgi:AcrR family transcriptional regulator
MARPRNADGRNTREAILEAALELFAERGFFGTSTREIARAVGVRESALYHHFESKDAIFHALIDQNGPGRMRQLVAIDVDSMLEAMEPKAMLKRVLDVMVATFSIPNEQKMFRLLVQEGARIAGADVGNPVQALGRVRQGLAAVFTKLVERKAIRPVDPSTTALMLMGPIALLRFTHLLRQPDFKVFQSEIDRFFEQFWESIKPPEAPIRARRLT